MDKFYNKIAEDRKRELNEEINKRRKLVTDIELKNYRCEDILNEYEMKH